MISMRHILRTLQISILLLSFQPLAVADELEMLNRPINMYGLTGLLHVTAPYTLPPGTIEMAVVTMTEQSYEPDYAVLSMPVAIAYGLSDTMEVALRSTYWKEEESQLTQRRGIGDTELAVKWDLFPPKEFSSVPSAAVLLSGIAPTGDREAGTYEVVHWGARAGLAVGSEIMLEDYVIGVYADGQIVVQDLSDDRLRDRYHLVNAGVLLPISKYRNLQMFVEYNRQKGKEAARLRTEDHSAVTYGLRLVSSRFNLTIGTQFIHKYADEQGNSSSIIGLASIKI